MSSGSFDEKSFSLCCQLFLKHSDRLGDGWSWERLQVSGNNHTQHSEEGYLRKTSVRCVTITNNHEDPDPQPAVEVEEVSSIVNTGEVGRDDAEEDEACVASRSVGGAVLQYEYHILFSCSYGMPVLYFTVFDLEGRSVCLEQVWDLVHPNYRKRLQQSPWSTITQQEHPMLGRPFFVLHPCKTEEFMKVNHLVTWLSVVAPLVGLDLPLSYSTLLLHEPDPQVTTCVD
ncbi:hypothetical protein NHX12_004510 [Muraenolepis orangiensis]|uniref:Ubiquitin-like-conjugating enzyme ATG10 n=1 Tax=Muraenolepis orangiensis TaxID=630683 RepID=A0A9Q0DVC4_9TELE|nr:hypothetical protein NHX12_004510 [Muraenolepis orangiensis]